jgi:hypothetical protein
MYGNRKAILSIKKYIDIMKNSIVLIDLSEEVQKDIGELSTG